MSSQKMGRCSPPRAVCVDETGDRLVTGSTTGALWITEDQGDLWQLIHAHLPPLFCTLIGEVGVDEEAAAPRAC